MILAICLLAASLTLALNNKDKVLPDLWVILGALAFVEMIGEICVIGTLMGA